MADPERLDQLLTVLNVTATPEQRASATAILDAAARDAYRHGHRTGHDDGFDDAVDAYGILGSPSDFVGLP